MPERVEAERLFDPQAVETRHPHVDDAGEELAVLKCVTGADRTHDGLIAGSDGISRVPELLEEHQRGIGEARGRRHTKGAEGREVQDIEYVSGHLAGEVDEAPGDPPPDDGPCRPHLDDRRRGGRISP